MPELSDGPDRAVADLGCRRMFLVLTTPAPGGLRSRDPLVQEHVMQKFKGKTTNRNSHYISIGCSLLPCRAGGRDMHVPVWLS
jgi:hypothetical protein